MQTGCADGVDLAAARAAPAAPASGNIRRCGADIKWTVRLSALRLPRLMREGKRQLR